MKSIFILFLLAPIISFNQTHKHVSINSPEITKVSEKEYKIKYEVNDETFVHRFELELSADSGKTWKVYSVQFPNTLNAHQIYYATVKL